MKTKTRIILTSTLAILGLGMSGTGIYLELNEPPVYTVDIKTNYDKPIEQEFIITLKEVKLSLNSSLSMDIQSYIEEPVENSILQSLILDTSKVDTSKTGTYTYTITHQKKIFEGVIIVEETVKEENILSENTMEETQSTKLTLKPISLKLGEKLSTDVSYYVVEQLTDEVKQQIKLDTSDVVINKPGTYQYTITYNNTYYTGTIKIEEDQKIETSKPQEEVTTEEKENAENIEESTPNTNTTN